MQDKLEHVMDVAWEATSEDRKSRDAAYDAALDAAKEFINKKRETK